MQRQSSLFMEQNQFLLEGGRGTKQATVPGKDKPSSYSSPTPPRSSRQMAVKQGGVGERAGHSPRVSSLGCAGAGLAGAAPPPLAPSNSFCGLSASRLARGFLFSLKRPEWEILRLRRLPIGDWFSQESEELGGVKRSSEGSSGGISLLFFLLDRDFHQLIGELLAPGPPEGALAALLLSAIF